MNATRKFLSGLVEARLVEDEIWAVTCKGGRSATHAAAAAAKEARDWVWVGFTDDDDDGDGAKVGTLTHVKWYMGAGDAAQGWTAATLHPRVDIRWCAVERRTARTRRAAAATRPARPTHGACTGCGVRGTMTARVVLRARLGRV